MREAQFSFNLPYHLIEGAEGGGRMILFLSEIVWLYHVRVSESIINFGRRCGGVEMFPFII